MGSKKGSTKLKKLKKKVVNEYLTLHPDTNKTRLELESKFEKRFAKSKKLKISNDVVSISQGRKRHKVDSFVTKLFFAKLAKKQSKRVEKFKAICRQNFGLT